MDHRSLALRLLLVLCSLAAFAATQLAGAQRAARADSDSAHVVPPPAYALAAETSPEAPTDTAPVVEKITLIPIVPLATNTPTRTPTPINVGNFVWDDIDGDGRQDAGEPGLAGVTVQLWNGAMNDFIGQTTTNANGNYTLVAPTPGQYRVRVLLPSAGDQFSAKDQAGGDDLLDSDINPSGTSPGFTDIYNFASNLISITSIDAGIIKFRTATPTRTPTPINVGNFVWHDLNGNGVQNAGEPGVAGVTVQLWNGAMNSLIGQTTTNANGNYTLIAPTPGQYRVRVLLPVPGASFTLKDQGSDTADSDINPGGGSPGFTDIYDFGSNLISITSIDAGLLSATPFPTATSTPTRTPTSTATNTPTSTATSTVQSTPGGETELDPRAYFPWTQR